MYSNNRLNILFGIFIALLVGMNLLGGKITSLFDVSVSVAIFMVPVTFLITDIVEEVYGRQVARRFVTVGVIVLVALFAYVLLFVALPPHQRYPHNDAYRTVFGSSLRIILASITAFFLSQMHDVWAFEFWKKIMKGRALWLRNNLSTIVSQAIDTLVFMTIAFLYVAPQFTFPFVLELALPYYLFKVAFAVIDTPFVYLGVRWLKKGK